MNTSSLYMDNIFPKLATNFAQIIGDYYEKTTIHFFLFFLVRVTWEHTGGRDSDIRGLSPHWY